MAKKQTRSSDDADPLTHPLLERLGAYRLAAENLFAYSVKIVCGKQTDTNCCCVAGTRPGVYATEVNIQNLNLEPAPVVKLVVPLINSGAVVAREPKVYDPFAHSWTRDRGGRQTSPVGGDDGRLLPHRGVAAGRTPERRDRAHHRPPDDREPGRAVRLRGLHGEPSERGRHQHRRRVHSVATTGASRLGLVGSKNSKTSAQLELAAFEHKKTPTGSVGVFSIGIIHKLILVAKLNRSISLVRPGGERRGSPAEGSQ